MLFNSYSFIFLFLPMVFAGTFWLGKHSHRLAALWLATASLVFYAVWDSRFVLLLLLSIAFNYSAGYAIVLARARGQNSRPLLLGAVLLNLLLLGYFKYANFFLTALSPLLDQPLPALHIILPLGISFFTFTQIAFLVDVHRGVARENNPIHYLLFVTYFPHLIAGPVLHHKQMMPQFANPATYRIHPEHIAVGLSIFVLGLAKKVLLADSLAEHASPIFNSAAAGDTLSMLDAWVGALAYTLQLYFDFSGYSDMAIGLSLLFNIRLPNNFNSPYKATSIIDFWRRWHITLSTFLRDYLYFALGGNRHGVLRRYLNLLVTMLLGGLWHGAGWTFVVWGTLHGGYLMLNHGWRALRQHLGWQGDGRLGHILGGLLTFLAVVVAWVFFRADNLHTAWSILSSMAGAQGLSGDWLKVYAALHVILPCLALVWFMPNVRQLFLAYRPTWDDLEPAHRSPTRSWLRWQPGCFHALLLAALFLWCLDNLSKVSEFLYFQF